MRIGNEKYRTTKFISKTETQNSFFYNFLKLLRYAIITKYYIELIKLMHINRDALDPRLEQKHDGPA